MLRCRISTSIAHAVVIKDLVYERFPSVAWKVFLKFKKLEYADFINHKAQRQTTKSCDLCQELKSPNIY